MQLVLTEAEADTLALVLQACIEAEADPDRIGPLVKRLQAAQARMARRAHGRLGHARAGKENAD